MSRETFVIIGASLAGGSAAATLREEGFDGKVILVGKESELPYERPPLSKQYLRGEQPFEKSLVRPPEFWKENEIETLLSTTAVEIDPGTKTVAIGGGEKVPFDKVLVATGGRNRRFPIPGLDLEGVLDLRTVHDSDHIREEIAKGKKAVSVGMGFIGSEVAASLRQRGVEVTAIEGFKVPLQRVLGEEVGGVIAKNHRDHGVEMIFEDVVAEFQGSGRVERVVTKNGKEIECDFAVVGVGIEPVTEVVGNSGVEVDNGIVVDEFCRTNIEGIYAAGDVANHFHPIFGRRMRVEHWQNALRQGPAAARSMMGKGEPYQDVHWFWSDQYDSTIQYAGYHTEWDDLVVRGKLEERKFLAFYMKEGLVQAMVSLNRGRDLRRAMSLITARRPFDREQLIDEDLDLKTLAS